MKATVEQEKNFLEAYFKAKGFEEVSIRSKYNPDIVSTHNRFYEVTLSHPYVKTSDFKSLRLGYIKSIDWELQEVYYIVDKEGLARTRRMINSL